MIPLPTLSRRQVEEQLDHIAKRFDGGCLVSHMDGRQEGRFYGTRVSGSAVYILIAPRGGGDLKQELPGWWQRKPIT